MENLQNEYTLTPDELGMIQPLIDNVEALQKEAQAILRAITRLRHLDGNWNLMGNKLIKVESTNAQPTRVEPAELAPANGRLG
jgi:hypothetical protein